ncbi:uncharacterized protein LOC144436387 [Glandiceps talaboti]
MAIYISSEPEPEPETEPEDHTINSGNGAAEPVPDWTVARQVWSVGWELHVYGLGSVYAVLTILCSVVIVRSYVRKTHRVPAYSTCVRIVLLIFGLLRSICLFTDAYQYRNVFTPLAYSILWILAEPFFLSSFSVYFLVLQEATMFRPRRKNFRVNQSRFLFGFVSVHFILAIISPVVFNFVVSVGNTLQIICGTYYILIGLVVVGCFSYLSRKLQLHYNRMRRGYLLKATLKEDMSALLKILVHVYMLMASGIIICALHLYGLLGVYKVLATNEDNIYIDPWPWWVYQTVFRLTELFIAFVLFHAVNNSRKIKKKMSTIKSRLDSSTSQVKNKDQSNDDTTSMNHSGKTQTDDCGKETGRTGDEDN